jgi:hypothetical protein
MSNAIDLYAKSKQLLEQIATSVHERNPTSPPLFFNVAEMQVVQDWLQEFMKELKD